MKDAIVKVEKNVRMKKEELYSGGSKEESDPKPLKSSETIEKVILKR